MQRKELERIKPPKYREKVKVYLANKGYSFSLETIQKVYSGKRNNIIIAKAIVTVFNNYLKEKQHVDSTINSVIAHIHKDIP